MNKNYNDDARIYSYGEFSFDHLKSVRKGIKLFNEQMFWECHEELEGHWLDDIADNGRYVYWAIIQVATCLYHLRDGNIEGAKGMLRKAQDKIIQCDKRRVNTDLVYKYLSWKHFSKLVMSVTTDNAKKENFEDLVQFRFPRPADWRLES